MIKTFICDFETGIIRRTIKCDQRRRVCRTIAFKTKKRMKNEQSEEFYERENFVLNSLINFEPVKI